MADERRLTQVLRNLIDNACNHTGDGVIELGITSVNGGDAAGGSQSAGERLIRFALRDTGVGIAADQHETIFEPFKRLDRYDRAPGLGLGLTISQQIVTAMGGRIRLQSRQGSDSGSLFSFDLRLPTVEVASGSAPGTSQRGIVGYQGSPGPF
jgi:signal transduction histidine kinase